MRFTIGSRARSKASAFNPSSLVTITDYHPEIFDAFGQWAPMKAQRFDGQPFNITAGLRSGTLECSKHSAAWFRQQHLTVLPDLCEQPALVPQPVVDAWEQSSGQEVRDQLERISVTQAAYFAGA